MLVSDLLMLARSDAGVEPEETTVVDLRAVAARALDVDVAAVLVDDLANNGEAQASARLPAASADQIAT